MKVLMTGATGFVGKRVVKQLLSQGHEVVVLTRNIPHGALTLGKGPHFVYWGDTTSTPPAEAYEGVDGIINLMGEGIAEKRWSEEQKKKIYDSRIVGTSKLVEGMKSLSRRPKALVSASAVGIYGDRGEELLTEEASMANDFLATVCKDWELEANKAQELGLRVATIRTGVVIGKDGGALSKMLLPFKMGVGGKLGSGDQYMSWIHVDDLAAMYVTAVTNPEIRGVYNGTAPTPVTNTEFTKTLGKVLHRPTVLPAPAFAMKAAFGEMSVVLLSGQKVVPQHFQKQQFKFRYPTLDQALKMSV